MNYSGLISFRINWFDLLAVQGPLKSLLKHHSSRASNLLLPKGKGVGWWGYKLGGYNSHTHTHTHTHSTDAQCDCWSPSLFHMSGPVLNSWDFQGPICPIYLCPSLLFSSSVAWHSFLGKGLEFTNLKFPSSLGSKTMHILQVPAWKPCHVSAYRVPSVCLWCLLSSH